MPTRTAAIEFKDIPASEMRATNDRQGIIEGLVSKTGNIDLQDDRVLPGAWRDTIKSAYQRKASGDPYLVPFLWSHNFDALPPGGVFYLDETKQGLFAKVQLNREIQSGAELYASYKAGTVSKQSIGYRTVTSDYEKIEGKTVRNLRACELLECSAVLFPANPMAVVTAVKGGSSMFARTKDFNSNYQAQQLDDWQYDDWSGISSALQQSIMELFAPGRAPLADFERDVLPGLLAALRQYIQDGINLGFSTAPASAQEVYAMSMSGAGSESKAGYLNASDHAAIKESSSMIMKHAKIIASASARVENANARARANALQGYQVYSDQASAPSYFEQKEAEEDIRLQLSLINTRLQVDAALREGKEALIESTPSPTAGVERAIAALAARWKQQGS